MRKTVFLLLFLVIIRTIFSQETISPVDLLADLPGEGEPVLSRITGDTCADPFIIASLPYSDIGTTTGFTNDYDEVCPYSGSTSPDVIYEYTPTDNVLVNVSLCNDGTDYDTKLYIYENTCESVNAIACNDDACSTASYPNPFVSELIDVYLLSGHTYYIVIDGYGNYSGNYELTIEAEAEYDFGDAPDPTFPTLLASNGARHIIVPGISLGYSVDPDPDGQPASECNGDDLDGNDDEDGVYWGLNILGQQTFFDVIASVPGFLNAWIDYNNDGDWDDDSEFLFNNEPLTVGYNSLYRIIPDFATLGYVAARFRFTDYFVTDPSYDGPEMNGEVEDHNIPIRILDFGDAPDPPYPTLLASQGARHLSSEYYYLGTLFDGEADGYPSLNADGDDLTGLDDEDGVIFPILQRGRTDSITVQVGGTIPAHLHIWVDFNQDGHWSRYFETVHSSELNQGIHTIPIHTPLYTLPGTTYARCRLNSSSYCEPWFLEYSGEVEDYLVTIEDDTTNIKWSQPPVSNPESSVPINFWGWDQISIYGDSVIVADDWLCSDLSPVKEIHWWGSYHWWDGYPPTGPGTPTGFHIGIWTDQPAGGENPWSHPAEMIWQYTISRDSLNETVAGLDWHPDYSSMEDVVFEYTCILPQEHWFYQLPPVGIYWISISAVYEDTPDRLWGWLSREPCWNDAAVRILNPTMPDLGFTFTAGEPIIDSSFNPWDMSFVLMTGPHQLTAPVDVAITVYQDSSLVKIEWGSVSGATYYLVYSSLDSEASYPSGWTCLGITQNLFWNEGPPLPAEEKKFYKVVAY